MQPAGLFVRSRGFCERRTGCGFCLSARSEQGAKLSWSLSLSNPFATQRFSSLPSALSLSLSLSLLLSLSLSLSGSFPAQFRARGVQSASAGGSAFRRVEFPSSPGPSREITGGSSISSAGPQSEGSSRGTLRRSTWGRPRPALAVQHGTVRVFAVAANNIEKSRHTE